VELDTPNVAVTVLQPGDVRVDVDPRTDTTTITVASGQVQVDGNGLSQTLQAGQRVRLSGSNPVAAQWLYAGATDGLDAFSSDRDSAYESSLASEQADVNPGTIGAADLANAGSWETESTDGDDGGPIWYPTGVAVDWAPYSCGHWTWIAPWGWTWVDCARWGFAPFHYGRWEHRRGRWGWRPGPPVIRPIYAPALVVFVGGPSLAVNGLGVTAWFPLGPREEYVPWYHTSAVYLNRVNVSNVYDRNANRVRMEYNQRSVSPAFTGGGERTYANRQVGTIAVAQASFAAGKPVARGEVRLSAGELAAAPVIPHPLVTPQKTMVAATAARAVPRMLARPELASREDRGVRAPEAVERAAPGNVERVAPESAPQQAPVNRMRPSPLGDERAAPIVPAAPVVHAAPPAQAAPVERAPLQAQPTHTPPQRIVEGAPEPPSAPLEQPTADPQQPRPLFNRAVPPEPRPSFEQQQKAIESTDPGRPLSPQQMQSVRQSQPVQREPQREAPHPAAAPAPRPAPAARPSPPPAAAPRKP
jgi:hypothetical protein